MKTIITVILFAFVAVVKGQDVTNYSQDSIAYLTDSQEAFMIDKETKYLVKTGPLGVEAKLNESFSLNFVFQPSYIGSRGLNLIAGAELRYYYKLANLIKTGKQANNLSSEYIGADIEYEGIPFTNSIYTFNQHSYGVTWGSQKRFLNYGYLDFGARLSYGRTNFPTFDLVGNERLDYVTLSNRTAVGFAFGKRYKIEEMTTCPIFKCHLDRKSAFKISFNRLFNIGYLRDSRESGGKFAVNLRPNIAYETKIGSSSFSIDQDLNLAFNFTTRLSEKQPKAGVKDIYMSYTAGVRHYFKQKSKIRSGKSGNNLQGMYWTAGTSIHYGKSRQQLIDQVSESRKHHFVNGVVGFGYQKMVLNDFYFDFRSSLEIRLKEYKRPLNSSVNKFGLYLDFKVGKMF